MVRFTAIEKQAHIPSGPLAEGIFYVYSRVIIIANHRDVQKASFCRNQSNIIWLSTHWEDRPGIVNTITQPIVMKRTTFRERPPMPATGWVQVEVKDSSHTIEHFTDLFDSHQMNIAELVSRTQTIRESQPPLIYIQITAHSPASQYASFIEQGVNHLCTALQVQGTIGVVQYPQHNEKMESSDESTESW